MNLIRYQNNDNIKQNTKLIKKQTYLQYILSYKFKKRRKLPKNNIFNTSNINLKNANKNVSFKSRKSTQKLHPINRKISLYKKIAKSQPQNIKQDFHIDLDSIETKDKNEEQELLYSEEQLVYRIQKKQDIVKEQFDEDCKRVRNSINRCFHDVQNQKSIVILNKNQLSKNKLHNYINSHKNLLKNKQIENYPQKPFDSKLAQKFITFCKLGNIKILKKLILIDPSLIHQYDDLCFTGLQWSVIRNQAECVDYLLQCGSYVDWKNNLNKTSLYYALKNKNKKIIKILLKNNAYPWSTQHNDYQIFLQKRNSLTDIMKKFRVLYIQKKLCRKNRNGSIITDSIISQFNFLITMQQKILRIKPFQKHIKRNYLNLFSKPSHSFFLNSFIDTINALSLSNYNWQSIIVLQSFGLVIVSKFVHKLSDQIIFSKRKTGLQNLNEKLFSNDYFKDQYIQVFQKQFQYISKKYLQKKYKTIKNNCLYSECIFKKSLIFFGYFKALSYVNHNIAQFQISTLTDSFAFDQFSFQYSRTLFSAVVLFLYLKYSTHPVYFRIIDNFKDSPLEFFVLCHVASFITIFMPNVVQKEFIYIFYQYNQFQIYCKLWNLYYSKDKVSKGAKIETKVVGKFSNKEK